MQSLCLFLHRKAKLRTPYLKYRPVSYLKPNRLDKSDLKAKPKSRLVGLIQARVKSKTAIRRPQPFS